MVCSTQFLGRRSFELVFQHWIGKNTQAFIQVIQKTNNIFHLKLNDYLLIGYLSNRGRCLAQVMLCYLHPSAEALDQLEKWSAVRQNSDCKSAVEVALNMLKSDNADGIVLLQNVVPLLYSRTYLSRLFMPA